MLHMKLQEGLLREAADRLAVSDPRIRYAGEKPPSGRVASAALRRDQRFGLSEIEAGRG